MKSTLTTSSLVLLATTATAKPQGPPGDWGGGNWGGSNGGSNYGPFTSFPSCVQNCWQSLSNNCNSYNDYSCFCSSSTLSDTNSCIESSSCSDGNKSDVYEAVAQLCANAGQDVSASPEATFSATSGGSAWPSGWTTQSGWPSGGAWGSGNGGGWSGSGWGPFGQNADGNGWGPWESSGAWTDGPWTNWWGDGNCPGSTWSGWTNGPWGTSAPWTTWAGCTASTTGQNVYTTQVTASNGTVNDVTTTSFEVKVAPATGIGQTGSGAGTIVDGSNVGLAASAVAALGVLAGAVLL